jgi:hypothetical protein
MTLGNNEHLNDSLIERYSMGTATADEIDRCDEHLLICESCRERVTASDDYVRAMESGAAQIRERERRRTFWRRTPVVGAIAAATVIAAMLGARWINRLPIATVTVTLAATRGSPVAATAPSHRILRLSLDTSGLRPVPRYLVEVVNSRGTRLWQGDFHGQDRTGAVTLPPMDAGMYFVRVYAPPDELLREYGLNVE